jgi:uncharacterized membrane protein YeaQ/YmgE (transglycosylase-associated protein family)
MDLIVLGVVAGVLGSLTMDVSNHLLARTGVLVKIDLSMIGRMAAGWARGRFRYGHPRGIQQVARERSFGYLAHYMIGVGLAVLYVFGWNHLIGGFPSPLWAVAYGAATTLAAYLVIFPSIGLGVCGRHSPDGITAPLSSLVNHIFFGIGMALGIALI